MIFEREFYAMRKFFMKRFYLLSMLCVIMVCAASSAVFGDVVINEENFPDPAFRDYVRSWFDGNGDNILDERELSHHIQMVRFTDGGYKSLKGIELIPGIKTLDISNQEITQLDLSGYNDMENLSISDTTLVSLDITNMKGLKKFYCWAKPLTSIKVSGCSSLESFRCFGTSVILSVSEIDLSGCTSLQNFSLDDTSIKTLDLSMCPKLISVGLRNNNQLTTLNISNSPELESLACNINQLTALDLSGHPKLKDLECRDNHIGFLDFASCPVLERANCTNNDLMSVDVSGCLNLSNLQLGHNHLTELDLSTRAIDIVGHWYQERFGAELVSLGLNDDGLSEYHLDMSPYVSDISRIYSGFSMYDSDDNPIMVGQISSGSIVKFLGNPSVKVDNAKIQYSYKTKQVGKDDLNSHMIVYLRDLKIVSSNSPSPEPTPEPDPSNSDVDSDPSTPDNTPQQTSGSNSSGGGCNSGIPIVIFFALVKFIKR